MLLIIPLKKEKNKIGPNDQVLIQPDLHQQLEKEIINYSKICNS